MVASIRKGRTTYDSNPSPTASVVLTSHSQSGTTLRYICMLCCVTQEHPNRQTFKGMGKEKCTPWKEERYADNKVKRLLYIEKSKSVSMMRMWDQWTG
jgi:hypothetical protein